MRSIEEVLDYLNPYKKYDENHNIFEFGFLTAIKFTQRWLSIREELPKCYEIVNVKLKDGTVTSAWRRLDDNDKSCYTIAGTKIIVDITHWRSIKHE